MSSPSALRRMTRPGRFKLLPAALLLFMPLLAPAAQVEPPAIKTVASNHARFFGHQVLQLDGGLRVRGQLLKSMTFSRSLFGHIKVQLLDAEGRILQTLDAQHRHFPLKTRQLRFSIDLPDVPGELHTIRLIHVA